MTTAIQSVTAHQQKFRLTPQDLQVLEGSDALLRCEVSYLAGQVQWTKDGFALGKLMFNIIRSIQNILAIPRIQRRNALIRKPIKSK